MTALTLIIGNKNYSSWSLRAWLFLQQNQIAFTEQRIALFTKDTNSQLAKFNSDLKVPVLIVESPTSKFEIWDSLAILEYISEQHLSGRGLPTDTKARAIARSVSCEMHSSFINIRNEMPMNCRKIFTDFQASDNANQEIDRITNIWKMCRQQFGINGDWLFGEFSIADAMFGPIILRFIAYNIPLSGVAKTYAIMVMRQPAVKQWIAAGVAETEIITKGEI